MRRFHRVGGLVLVLGLVPGASADEGIAGLRVAPGYKVEIAASEPLVVNPVTMTFGDDGRLFVIEWRAGRGPNDQIKALVDVDGDGRFDKAEPYMDGLELPAGLLFRDGWTYVTLDHDVVRLRDDDKDGTFEKRETIVTGFGNDDSHHRVSGLIEGPDGWIYTTTGDSDARAKGSDGSTATVLRCGGVFRCRPDGSRLEAVAFGMRNPWGNVAFDARFEMYHTDNDNEGSPGFTGCRLLHVVEGGDYGWRLREGARCCQPAFERATWNGGRPGRLGWMAETGRGAPAGLCVLDSAAFPESSRGWLVYPDVFRKKVRAYRTKPVGASYTIGEEFELLGSDDGLFRPTDAEIGPDGALYVLDWRTDSGGAGQLSGNGRTGRIYRITWSGTAAEPARPTLDRKLAAAIPTADDATLIRTLESDHFPARLRAGSELIRRKAGAEGLAKLALDRTKGTTPRLHALAVLASTAPAEALKVWKGILPDERDAEVLRVVYEQIARFGPTDDDALAAGLARRLDHVVPSARRTPEGDRVERALALALGRFTGLTPLRSRPPKPGVFAQQQVADAVLTAAAARLDADEFLRDAFTRTLELVGSPALLEIGSRINDGDVDQRAAAFHVLQGWRGVEGRDMLLSQIERPIPPETKAGLFRALREMAPGVPAEPIADWLAASRAAEEAPARVEAIRALAAQGEASTLSALRVLPGALRDADADVRKAALALAGRVRSTEVKETLVGLVGKVETPADERRLALAALAGYGDKSIAPLLIDLLGAAPDAEAKVSLLGTLAALDFPAAASRAERLLLDPRQEVRAGAIAVLGRKPETALAVARLFNEEKLPPEDLPRVIDAARPHATPELQAAVQTLLKNRLLAAPKGEAAERLRQFVGRRGNAERGRGIYLDPKKGGCVVCHRLEGSGGVVGPDLTKVWETLSFDKRVEAILEPSKEIKEGYASFKVATTDGRVLTGLLLADVKEGVTLRDAGGKEVRIPAAEVEQKGFDKTSLMPVGVVGHLSFDELADLLAFLGDRRAQEALRTAK